MPETLTIVVAIFGLVGLGYASARTGLLSTATGEALTDFVFKVAIPLLIFDTLATADLHGLSPWRVWAAYFVPFGIVWVTADRMVRRLFGRDARAGVVAGGSAAYANSVLIGIPLIRSAFGEDGTVFLIVIVAVHLPVMMLLSVALNDWAGRGERAPNGQPQGAALKRTASVMAKHPILLGVLAGILWRITGLPLPGLLASIVESLGASAGPLALFASGMALVQFGVARQVGPALAISGLKLLVMPALVFMAASLLGLPPLGVAVVTLTAACPTGVNAFLIASRLGTGEALASNALLISTAAAALTVTIWLIVLQRLVPV